MPSIHPQSLSLALLPAALPCAANAPAPIAANSSGDDTPDAILDCSASDPQSKYWRGPGRTTTRR